MINKTKYNFVGLDGKSYPFTIETCYLRNIKTNIITKLFIVSLCYLSDDEHGYAPSIIKNELDEFIVEWQEHIIEVYKNIVGYKEFIDRTVRLLSFT